MKSRTSWFVASVSVISAVVVLANVTPQQRLLSQCADQINDYPCVYQRSFTRECCIPYPYQRWRVAWCLVDQYVQYRQPPQPPSVYFTNRRNCTYTGEACTPMPRLVCPSP